MREREREGERERGGGGGERESVRWRESGWIEGGGERG